MALRLRDPEFTSTFWSQLEGIVQTEEKSRESHWKSWKELQDKFGDEAESMAAVFTKRPHPKNPRVFQWYVEDDRSKLTVAHYKKHQLSGSSKVDKGQAKAISEAMNSAPQEEEQLQLMDKDVASDVDMEELQTNEMPPWMRRIADATSQVGSSKGQKQKKDIADKFQLAEEDSGLGHVAKLEMMIKKLVTNMESEEYVAKSSKYKLDGELKKDFLLVKTKLEHMQTDLHKVVVMKNASKEKIQQDLIRGCTLFKEGDIILKRVQALNKEL